MNGDTKCIPNETSDDIDVPCGVDNKGMNNDTPLGKYSKVCHSDNQSESCQPETECVLEPIGEDEKTGSENHNISFHNQKVTCVVQKCQESTKTCQSLGNQGVTFRPVNELSFIQEADVASKHETGFVNQQETNTVNQQETNTVNQQETNVATQSDKNVLCSKEISSHKHPNTDVEQATGKVWNLSPLTMHNNLEIQHERNQETTDERQKEMGIAVTKVISPKSKSSLNHQGILVNKHENNYVRKRHETDKGRRKSSGKRVSTARKPRRGRSKRIQWVDVEDGASLDEEFSVHQYRPTSTSKTVLYFAIFICLLSLFGNIATMALLSRGTKVCPKGLRLLLQVQTASDIAIIASTLCIVIWIAWDSLRQR